MKNPPSQQITLLLTDLSNGDQSALENLSPIVYDELNRMARRYMHGQSFGHTFQTTELIHEAFLIFSQVKKKLSGIVHRSSWLLVQNDLFSQRITFNQISK